MAELQEGDLAPDFSLAASSGGEVRLSDFREKEPALQG